MTLTLVASVWTSFHFITFSREQSARISAEEAQLDRILTAAEIGRWTWDISTGKLTWDDAMFPIYGIKRADWTPDYDSFANAVHPLDREWVNDAVNKTIEDRSYYRAVFRTAHGNLYVRAYARMIQFEGRWIMAGICVPATAHEYTGRPLSVSIKTAQSNP